MIVDCHTHITLGSDESALSEHLAGSEPVDVCVVLAGCDGPSAEANKELSEYVGKYKDKMVGFGVVNPIVDKLVDKGLKSLRDKLGLSGAVLYCSACGFHPTHSRAMHFYEFAEEASMPVFFHNSGHLGSDAILDYAQPFLLDEIARTFGELKIVIGGMGQPFVEQTLSMVAKHKNVYADLTIKPENIWHIYNIVMAAYERGLMDKLLFGSGFPESGAGACMETLLGFNKLLGDSKLPAVPRGNIRNVIERDTLGLLGIEI